WSDGYFLESHFRTLFPHNSRRVCGCHGPADPLDRLISDRQAAHSHSRRGSDKHPICGCPTGIGLRIDERPRFRYFRHFRGVAGPRGRRCCGAPPEGFSTGSTLTEKGANCYKALVSRTLCGPGLNLRTELSTSSVEVRCDPFQIRSSQSFASSY